MNDKGKIFFDVMTVITANRMDIREATLIAETEQPPITIVMLISHHISLLKKSGQLDSYHAIAMEDRLTRWVEEFGAHERILNTPTYTAFTRQTSRFLILYLVFLPFGLSAFLSWSTCGCMPVLCFLIVGIDNIASATENPCTSLPLRALAAGHANVVDVILRTKKSPSLTAILEMT